MSRVYMQKTRMRNCLKCPYNFGFLQIMYVKTILINIKLSCLWRCHHVRRSGIRVASLFLMLARFQEPLTKTKHHSLFPFCSFVPRVERVGGFCKEGHVSASKLPFCPILSLNVPISMS